MVPPASTAAAPAPSSCTVAFEGARASVACTGPLGAVSLAPASNASGVVLTGEGVLLADPACVAMPLSRAVVAQDDIPSGTAAVAMLRLCATGPLVLECNVSRVVVRPSSDAAVALSVVVSAGGLTLRDSVVEGVRGGTGVHLAASGDVRVLNSSFLDNTAAAGNTSRGGGLVVVAAAGTRLVFLEGNRFARDVAGRGAGAWVDLRAVRPGARCVLAGANVFEHCQARSDIGGGIYLNASDTAGVGWDVGGSAAFMNNTGSGLVGVFQRTVGGSVSIEGTANFKSNAGDDGGAVYLNFLNSTVGKATIAGKTSFQGNAANSWGGAVFLNFVYSTAGNATVAGNASFEGNVADFGGAAYLHFLRSTNGTATVAGKASFQDNATISGGAVLLNFMSSTAGNATVAGDTRLHANNANDFGGAVFMMFYDSISGNATVAGNASFQGNAVKFGGGAVCLAFGNATAGNATVTGNASFQGNAADSIGGAVFLDISDSESSAALFQGAAFIDNAALSVGGALVAYANTSRRSTKVAIEDCTFMRNRVRQGFGGGAAIVAGPPTANDTNAVYITVSGTLFQDNVVRSGVGGGLHLDGTSSALKRCYEVITTGCPSTASLQDVKFSGNQATLGGGLYAINTQCSIQGGAFLKNNATQSGGGFFAKGVRYLELADVVLSGNRARVTGGGLATVLGDDFQANAMVCYRCSLTNNVASSGGGVHHGGGYNVYSRSTVAGNNATQQGGGIVFQNICGEDGSSGDSKDALHDTCVLSVEDGTRITNNRALVGGGVAVTVPGGRGVNVTALAGAARGNVARYAKDVAVAPGANSLTCTITTAVVPSSTGRLGAIDLVAATDREGTRLQVEFCDVEQRGEAYLTGTENATVPTACGKDGEATCYATAFSALRLMGGKPQAYRLCVFAPDFPLVDARSFNLTVRSCGPGERDEAVSGCTPCAPGRYSFTARLDGECPLCPTYATCAGGAALVPLPGFWHSAWNSSRLSQCPNRDACCGDRAALAVCQAQGPACPGGYWDRQCRRGYRGRLCMRCAPGYGSGLAFRCGRCASRSRTAALLVFLAAAVCLGVAAVGLRSVYQGPACADAVGAAGGRAGRLAAALGDMEVADVFKVLVVYLQYVGILRNLVIAWPPAMRRLMDLSKALVGPGSSDWVSLDCLIGGPAGQQPGGAAATWLRLALTLAAVALAAAAACAADRLLPGAWAAACAAARRLRGGAGPQPPTAAGGPRRERAPMPDVVIATAVVGVFTTFASLATTVLGAFACLDVDGQPYWSRDARLRCWRGAHLRGAVAPGALCLAAVAVAVPAAAAALGMRRRQLATAGADAGAEARHDRRYGFLYRLYRPSCRHWEALLCVQTLALVAVDQFARQLGPLYQLVSVMVILLVATAAWVVQRPLRSRTLTRLYLAGMLTLMLTCLMMMLLLRGYRRVSGSAAAGAGDDDVLQGASRAAVAALMVLANALFVAACLHALAHVGLAALFAQDGWLRRAVRRAGCWPPAA